MITYQYILFTFWWIKFLVCIDPFLLYRNDTTSYIADVNSINCCLCTYIPCLYNLILYQYLVARNHMYVFTGYTQINKFATSIDNMYITIGWVNVHSVAFTYCVNLVIITLVKKSMHQLLKCDHYSILKDNVCSSKSIVALIKCGDCLRCGI